MADLRVTIEQATLIAAILAFVASLGAGAISLYTSRLRRFTSERWWERKAHAYSDLLELLVKLRYASAGLEAAALTSRLVPGKRLEQLKELGDLLLELRRVETRGAFVLSDKVIGLVEGTRKQIIAIMESVDAARISAEVPRVVERTIAEVRRVAAADLKVR